MLAAQSVKKMQYAVPSGGFTTSATRAAETPDPPPADVLEYYLTHGPGDMTPEFAAQYWRGVRMNAKVMTNWKLALFMWLKGDHCPTPTADTWAACVELVHKYRADRTLDAQIDDGYYMRQEARLARGDENHVNRFKPGTPMERKVMEILRAYGPSLARRQVTERVHGHRIQDVWAEFARLRGIAAAHNPYAWTIPAFSA